MTYDDSDFIRKTYRAWEDYIFSLRYSLQKKQEARELLIAPDYLTMPNFAQLSHVSMDLRPLQDKYIN